jgi:hypothetical protein
MKVDKIYLLAMILSNAHNTMNGSNTCTYFKVKPPCFESWKSEGPRPKIN